MNIFISGGAKNGKSSIAEQCCVNLAAGGPLYYLATMVPYDDEDRARIQRHRESRAGKGFITVEQPFHMDRCLDKTDGANGTYILDSVTALMLNELYSSEGAMSEGKFSGADPEAADRVSRELTHLMKNAKNVVFVSDYIYSEMDNYSQFTLDYLKALSTVDKVLARECDAVAEICAGNINMLKGELPL